MLRLFEPQRHRRLSSSFRCLRTKACFSCTLRRTMDFTSTRIVAVSDGVVISTGVSTGVTFFFVIGINRIYGWIERNNGILKRMKSPNPICHVSTSWRILTSLWTLLKLHNDSWTLIAIKETNHRNGRLTAELLGNTLKPSIKFLSTPRGNDVPRDKTTAVVTERSRVGVGEPRTSGRDDIVAVVAVGREGVVCRGWGVTKEGWLCLSFFSYEIPIERGLTSLLASRFSLVAMLSRATYDAWCDDAWCVCILSLLPSPGSALKRMYITTQSHGVPVRARTEGTMHLQRWWRCTNTPFSLVVRYSVKGLKAWEGRCSRHEGKARAQRVQWSRRVSRQTGWLGWLGGWLAGWLAGWLVGWLAGWLTGWMTRWQSQRCAQGCIILGCIVANEREEKESWGWEWGGERERERAVAGRMELLLQADYLKWRLPSWYVHVSTYLPLRAR